MNTRAQSAIWDFNTVRKFCLSDITAIESALIAGRKAGYLSEYYRGRKDALTIVLRLCDRAIADIQERCERESEL